MLAVTLLSVSVSVVNVLPVGLLRETGLLRGRWPGVRRAEACRQRCYDLMVSHPATAEGITDEIGCRQSGANGYVWTFSTPTERYFLRRGRGKGRWWRRR